VGKYIFERQSKPVGKEKMELMFVDSNGKRYYKYIDDLDIPAERWGHINRLYQELGNCISGDELELFINAMDKELNPEVESGERKKIDIGKIIVLVKEMKMRKEMLLHPDLMIEIVSSHYIREDENAAVWDEELHREKCKQFQKDKGGGLRDFFQDAGLTVLMPFLRLSENDWKAYTEKSAKKRA